jgi:hypothetical protein
MIVAAVSFHSGQLSSVPPPSCPTASSPPAPGKLSTYRRSAGAAKHAAPLSGDLNSNSWPDSRSDKRLAAYDPQKIAGPTITAGTISKQVRWLVTATA